MLSSYLFLTLSFIPLSTCILYDKGTARDIIEGNLGKTVYCLRKKFSGQEGYKDSREHTIIAGQLLVSNTLVKNLTTFQQNITKLFTKLNGFDANLILTWEEIMLSTDYKLSVKNFPLRGNGAITLYVEKFKLFLNISHENDGVFINKVNLITPGELKLASFKLNGINMLDKYGKDIRDIMVYFWGKIPILLQHFMNGNTFMINLVSNFLKMMQASAAAQCVAFLRVPAFP